jgi:hypothetical protein
MPPPFLSHVEECTIRTALAFVVARARIRNRNTIATSVAGDDVSCAGMMEYSSKSDTRTVVRGRYDGDRCGGPSSFLGGLVPPPQPPRRSSTVQSSGRPSNDDDDRHNNNIDATRDLELSGRKMKHIRDVLRLAVSTVSPYYAGALDARDGGRFDRRAPVSRTGEDRSIPSEGKDDDDAIALGRVDDASASMDANDAPTVVGGMPCAVYDYEAAIESSAVVVGGAFPTRPATLAGTNRHRRATLDGLCQHVIVRLSRMMRDGSMRSGEIGTRDWGVAYAANGIVEDGSGKFEGGGDDDDGLDMDGGLPTAVTDGSRGSTTTATPRARRANEQCGIGIVRDAIARLIYDDLIGDACRHGSSQGSHSTHARGYAARRIERVMAVCHVLHRLLFLDKGCCLGTECVVVICSILNDLYVNDGYGVRFNGGDTCGGLSELKHCKSKFDNVIPPNSNDRELSQHPHNQKDKGKYQVVSSRWDVSHSNANIDARHVRHRMADISSWRQNRKQCRGENASTNEIVLPLPQFGDVLAVNLLRLLEGAAAMRIHHRREYALSSSRRASRRADKEYLLENASSSAATDVLTEIRSTVEHGLLIPLRVEDGAKFYFNEKIRSDEDLKCAWGVQSDVHLQPGAKMMLRLHLFDLMTKIALYERM